MRPSSHPDKPVLKFVFWSLLFINGLLFAYGQGYLGNFKGNEHEPQRLKNEVAADKLTLMSSASADVAVSKAQKAKADAEAPKPELIACMEIGKFSDVEAKRLEKLLAPLDLGTHQHRDSAASVEPTTHIVYIPPQGSKEGADKKAGELKNLGVTDFFVISDNSPLKWGISLGVFKSENAAKTLLAALNKQGVVSARIVARGAQANKVFFQFKDIDTATKTKLEKIVEKFPSADAGSCK
jgi:hypothetical protein